MTIFEYALTQESIGTVFGGVQPVGIKVAKIHGFITFTRATSRWKKSHHIVTALSQHID